jgi:1-deoxy-D-xylulose-5-phosphate reductoisomerase
VAVDAFLEGRLSFNGISEVIQAVLDAHDAPADRLTLDAVAEADRWAEQAASEQIARQPDRR